MANVVYGTSVINEVVEYIVDTINGGDFFAQMTRGALPTGAGLTCEVGPSSFGSMYMDKQLIVPLDLTFNGKNADLKVLSDALNGIVSLLHFKKDYPNDSERWQIVDIVPATMPQVIGREDNSDWLMAASVVVRFFWKG